MEVKTNDVVTLGKSILVPSVQELAKENLETVPETYIQLNQDPTIKLGGEDELNDLKVPTINMKALLAGDNIELERLHSACQEWGFFQVLLHLLISTRFQVRATLWIIVFFVYEYFTCDNTKYHLI